MFVLVAWVTATPRENLWVSIRPGIKTSWPYFYIIIDMFMCLCYPYIYPNIYIYILVNNIHLGSWLTCPQALLLFNLNNGSRQFLSVLDDL